MDEKTLLRLARTHATPLVVVDHKVLRENYGQFRKYLPRVQAYYAVRDPGTSWNVGLRYAGFAVRHYRSTGS